MELWFGNCINKVYSSEKTRIAIPEKHVWHIAQKNAHCNHSKTRLASQNMWNYGLEIVLQFGIPESMEL